MRCRSCQTTLVQPKIGRKRLYCSRRCKKRAERERGRFLPIVEVVSPPETPLSPPDSSLLRRPTRAPSPELTEEPHVVTTYSGDEWLARNRGGFPGGGQMHDPAWYGGDR
jgi:hypothetical protein